MALDRNTIIQDITGHKWIKIKAKYYAILKILVLENMLFSTTFFFSIYVIFIWLGNNMWVMLTVNSGFRASPTLRLCPTNLVKVCKPRNCSTVLCCLVLALWDGRLSSLGGLFFNWTSIRIKFLIVPVVLFLWGLPKSVS